jgi:EAL domain-containing protein (putative c-di-GMP-specific phosphodiesterase class I)
VRIADSLGLLTLAEGVESSAQVTMLQRLGCRLAQGHFYAPPLAADVATTLLAMTTAPEQPRPVDGAARG